MLAKIYRQIPKRYILLITGDFVILTVLIATVMRLKYGMIDNSLRMAILVSVFLYIFVFYIAGLYDLKQRFWGIFYLSRLLISSFLATFIIAGSFYFVFTWKLSRLSFFINVPLVIVFTFLWRLIFARIFKYAQRVQQILIIGAGTSSKLIYNILKKSPEFNVVGFIDDDPSKANGSVASPSVIGNYNQIYELSKKNKIDSLIIATRDPKNSEMFSNLLRCKMEGISVTDMATVYEENTGRIPIEHVRESWFIYSPMLGVKKSLYNQRIKRLLDIALSVAGLLVFLPIIILVSILIKIDSKGHVLFKQKRIGMNKKDFHIYKFRTMRIGTENDRYLAGKKNDPRITRVGKIIRTFRIDEIPQMINVLKGEMSFIGPRALIEEEVKDFELKVPYFSLRHSVRPGITGWAQVNYPHGTSVKDAAKKLQYDLYYIKNLSPFLESHILLKTFKVVLFRKGAK